MTTLLLLLLQLAVWQPVTPPILHMGHWQSCDHAERVLEHRVNGALRWEMHLGPDEEFAVYDHHVDHAEGTDDHASSANLLWPAYTYDAFVTRSGRVWTVPKLHLWISINRGGGSQNECMQHAFYIRIEDHR